MFHIGNSCQDSVIFKRRWFRHVPILWCYIPLREQHSWLSLLGRTPTITLCCSSRVKAPLQWCWWSSAFHGDQWCILLGFNPKWRKLNLTTINNPSDMGKILNERFVLKWKFGGVPCQDWTKSPREVVVLTLESLDFVSNGTFGHVLLHHPSPTKPIKALQLQQVHTSIRVILRVLLKINPFGKLKLKSNSFLKNLQN